MHPPVCVATKPALLSPAEAAPASNPRPLRPTSAIFPWRIDPSDPGLYHFQPTSSTSCCSLELASSTYPKLAYIWPSRSKETKKSDSVQVAEDLPSYSESSVDAMVEQRLGELQQYRRQVERNQRLASEGITSKDGVLAN